ncbi:MAG: colicin V production protein [Flavobacteriaceae bacterium]|nr:colicin V production protein [Flavobacteriaceae bacterium]|tara:strand:+ start:441114 stop:441641 length:528 start_codon:yes stop_codon:yes gene_type:complete
MSLNAFDIIILIILGFAAVRGFMKGLFVEVASIVALFAGAYAAIYYSHNLEYFLRESIFDWGDKTYRIVAFIVIFISVVILVVFLGKVLTKIADITALGLMNKILGGLFAVLKSALILSIVFTFFGRINDTLPFVKDETLDNSVFYHPIKEIAPALFPTVIQKDKDGRTKFEIPA